MKHQDMFNVVVCSPDPESTLSVLSSSDRRCEAVEKFVRLQQKTDLFQFAFCNELSAQELRFANCFLLLTTNQLDVVKQHGAPIIFCGPEHKLTAAQSSCAHIESLQQQFPLLLEYVKGVVIAKRPFSEVFLAERSSLVEKLKDPLQLASINKQLKEKGMKPALDLYFAADRVDNLSICLAFDCPQLHPFLLSKQHPDNISLVRKTAILASIQDEALRVVHSAFDPRQLASGAPQAQLMMVVSTNLTAVERLVVCDESRWYLLQNVLLAHQFGALPDTPVLSPRAAARTDATWGRNRKAAEMDEGSFIWESVEVVLNAHAQALGFVKYLVKDEIQRSDVTRVFREDSVATKWMSRVVKRSMPEISACIGEAVKHVMFVLTQSYPGTLSVDDLSNSVVILHSLFSSLTQLELPLDLRAALAATRHACLARALDPVQICSRLLLLRWIGPLLLTPAALVGIEALPEHLEQLKIASKLLVHLGEDSAAPDPLSIFNPWLRSVHHLWREYIAKCWDDDLIKAALRTKIVNPPSRATKQYSTYLQTVKEALQKVRGRVECKDWGDILGGSRKSLEM